MAPKKHSRQYDLVVFGATGYTGVYIAEFVTNSLPTNLRWAIAGRSRSKLEKIASDLKALNPERLQPDVEICGLNGSDLEALARKTFILITTVGPYAVSGEHAFKACAENGTHYLDVTGETPWVAKMIKKYETAAQASGALMIPQIGIDSCLPDVVTYTLTSLIRTELQAKTADVTVSVYRLNARPSGGTLASALGLFDSFSVKELNQYLSPFALSPVPNPRPPIKPPSLFTRLTGLRSVPHLGLQTTFIAGRTDGAIVERTWGLFSLIPSRKQEFYGPKFTFAEYLKAKSWLDGIVKHLGLAVAGMLLMLLPPFRWIVKKLVTKPGDGPDKEAAKCEDIDYRGVATPDLPGSSHKMAYCRAHYVGSMYNLTALFVTQAAMTLLEDDVELGPGILTPACLGQGYVDRLETGGFKIDSRLLDS